MRTNCEENETAASIQISVHTEFEFLSLISFSVLTNVNSIVQQKRLSSRYVQPRKVVRVFKKEREKKICISLMKIVVRTRFDRIIFDEWNGKGC